MYHKFRAVVEVCFIFSILLRSSDDATLHVCYSWSEAMSHSTWQLFFLQSQLQQSAKWEQNQTHWNLSTCGAWAHRSLAGAFMLTAPASLCLVLPQHSDLLLKPIPGRTISTLPSEMRNVSLNHKRFLQGSGISCSCALFWASTKSSFQARPQIDRANQILAWVKRGSWGPALGWKDIGHCWLMGEGEQAFFRDEAPKGLVMLLQPHT